MHYAQIRQKGQSAAMRDGFDENKRKAGWYCCQGALGRTYKFKGELHLKS